MFERLEQDKYLSFYLIHVHGKTIAPVKRREGKDENRHSGAGWDMISLSKKEFVNPLKSSWGIISFHKKYICQPTQKLQPFHSSEVARHVLVEIPHSIHFLLLIRLDTT